MASAYLSDTKIDIHKLYPTDFIFIFIVVACSVLGLNAYRFGDGMQLAQLPLLKQWIDSSSLNNDVWTKEVLPYYYSIFWPCIAWICKQSSLSLEWLFIAFYVLLLIFTFSGLFRLSLVITNDRGASYLALAMMVFSIEVIPGLPTISHHFEHYHVALPLVLHGVWLWLAGRPIQGFALIGLGATFHPLTGVYAVAFTLPFGFFPAYQRPVGEVILALFALVITTAPIWVWRLMNPDPAFDAWYYDANWINQVKLASGHVWNPLQWKWYAVVSITLASITILFCCLSLPSSNPRRWFSIMIVPTYLLLVCMSLVFTDIFPFPLLIQLQLPRALPFMLILSLPAVSLFLRNQVFNYGFTAKSVVLIGTLFLLFIPGKIIDGLGFLAIVLLVMLYLHSTSSRSYYERTLPLLLAMVLGLSAGLNYLLLPRFSLLNVQDLEWQALQKWAKKNTEKDAIFVCNPGINGFRYGADRGVWFNWDEGKMGMYTMAFSRYWQKQTNWLKVSSKQEAEENFNQLSKDDFKQIAKQYSKQPVYAIVNLRAELSGIPVTESTHYKVVKLQ